MQTLNKYSAGNLNKQKTVKIAPKKAPTIMSSAGGKQPQLANISRENLDRFMKLCDIMNKLQTVVMQTYQIDPNNKDVKLN